MAVKDRLYDVPVVGTVLRMQDRAKRDAADQLAAAIGFFGFLSLFPLIILALAVTGYVLRSNPAAQGEVVTAITEAIPGFSATLEGASGEGTSIATALETISENAGAIGLVGLATLLFSGLRVINAAMVSTTRIFRVPMPEGVKGRLRQLGSLALLGLLALAGAAAGTSVGIATGGIGAFVVSVLATAASLVLDLVLFLTAYHLLAARQGPGIRQLLPGAILAAVGWTVLKVAGAAWVSSQASDASALYGALGGVIGLLALFYLAGRLYIYGAELSALLAGIGAPSTPVAKVVGVHADTGPGAPAEPADGRRRDDERPAPPPPPPPRAPDPGPDRTTPSAGPATRRRIEQADTDRAAQRAHPDVRGALAFGLALTALGLLIRAYRPWGADR